jgi:hypothetical protein
VISIQLGLEDFAWNDERCIISAARNLYPGVVLLCKEVLRQLSPPGSNDILICTKKKAVREAGHVRPASLGGVIALRRRIPSVQFCRTWQPTRHQHEGHVLAHQRADGVVGANPPADAQFRVGAVARLNTTTGCGGPALLRRRGATAGA